MSFAAETIAYKFFLLALSPIERLEAIKEGLSGPDLMRDKWFILTGILIVVFLAVFLFFVRKRQAQKQTIFSNSLFESMADRLGLEEEDRKLLIDIAQNSCPHSPVLLFDSCELFDKGAAWLLNRSFKNGFDLEKRKRFNLKILEIKDKLGLIKPTYKNPLRSSKTNNITSRSVKVGGNIGLMDFENDTKKYQAEITEVNDIELWVRPTSFIEVEPGRMWRVHYQCGACVWEFISSGIGVQNGLLILSHSENVKFINRRRYQRVPIRRKCWVALFNSNIEIDRATQSPVPVFQTALTIEISGPGLKILTDIPARIGQRLLIVMDLQKGNFVQDIAEVRHITNEQGGKVLAVELIGLDDAAMAKLVKMTNEIAQNQHHFETEKELVDIS